MSKKVFSTDRYVKGEVEVYKNMGARKSVLLSGLIFCLAGFGMVLAALLILFVPSFAFKSATLTPMELNTYLYGFGAGAAFFGVVLSVAGANTAPGLAKFSFFLGSVAFIVGMVMLVLCLFFSAILPVDAINRLMGNAVLPF